MESAYVLANRELEEIRNTNKGLLDMRHGEVMAKAPHLADIETELMKQGSRLLKCVLNKCEDFEEIKSSIQKLQKDKAKLLKNNGFSEDYLDDIYSCKECRDTGFVEGLRCDCLKALVKKHLCANSNIADYMRNDRFENFDMSLFAQQDDENGKALKVMKIICDKALDFAENFDKTHDNFLIMGNAGTGKTFISSCIANHALDRGKPVYYQTAFRLFEIFEDAKFNRDEDASDIVKYVYDVDLLIIDDLGTEFSTQFTSAVLFDIVNTRILSGKSTVISSNLGFDEMSNIYSQRVVSRFMGDYKLFQTAGKDLRAVKRMKNKRGN